MGCKKCNDSGITIKDGEARPCNCVMVDNINEFCHHFARFEINKKYAKPEMIKDKVFMGMPYDKFGGIAKALLTYLYVKFINTSITWYDITGGDLVNSTFGKDTEYLPKDFIECDFLVIKLGRDASNKSLGAWLTNLITQRQELSNITWIYVYPECNEFNLQQMYTQEFVTFLNHRDTKFQFTRG